ncbi:hypothetical protein AVEN_214099-1 [Araneus ventricosus]|uniref:Tc3 transposase DNA binding domain-containing protein n=1 Tax=Araneus ventricosus TaxID=182803 RepID=A0A4Y2C6E9_ARAVE|nr:hypothetical protein AVEN_214099-1 [Araneus ventricosus]
MSSKPSAEINHSWKILSWKLDGLEKTEILLRTDYERSQQPPQTIKRTCSSYTRPLCAPPHRTPKAHGNSPKAKLSLNLPMIGNGPFGSRFSVNLQLNKCIRSVLVAAMAGYQDLSTFERGVIIGAREMGNNISEVAIKFVFSRTTISRVYREYRVSGKTSNFRHRCDRKKTLKELDH